MSDADPLLTFLQRRREVPLADEGFCQRVMDSLPHAQYPANRLRRCILSAGAVIGGISTLWLAPPAEGVFGHQGLAPLLQAVLGVGAISLIAACAAWAFVSASFRERTLP